jgi:hypothetical protein
MRLIQLIGIMGGADSDGTHARTAGSFNTKGGVFKRNTVACALELFTYVFGASAFGE